MATLQPVGMDTTTGQLKIARPADLINNMPVTGGTPSVSLSSAAGTGASYTISGTNLAGKISITTGLSLLSTGAVLTLTFADGFAFPNGCIVTFSAMDANFASVVTKLYVTTTTSTATINTALALSLSSTYTGSYTVVGW